MKATPQSIFLLPSVPAPERERAAKMTRFSEFVPREPAWLCPARGALWPARVAIGKVTILVGEAGLGKRAVAVDLAARVSKGLPWPEESADASLLCCNPKGETRLHKAPQGTTLVVCSVEEQLGSMRESLVAAGADLDKVCVVETAPTVLVPPPISVPPAEGEAVWEPPLLIPPATMIQQLAALQAALRATPDCKLVVIDLLSSFLGGPDGRRSQAMQILLRALAQMAAKFRVAIVAIEHVGGRATQRSIDRLLTTFGPPSQARCVWGVFRDPEDAERQLMLPLDGNFMKERVGLSYRLTGSDGTGPDGSLEGRLQRDAACRLSVQRVLAANSGFRIAEQNYRDKESFVMTRLREMLSSGPLSRTRIASEIRASEDQLYRAAKRLGVVSDKVGYLGGWTWMLPEHFPAWQAEQERLEEEQKQERRRRKNAKRRRERGEERSDRDAVGSVRPEEVEPTDASLEEEVARLMTPFPFPDHPEARSTEATERSAHAVGETAGEANKDSGEAIPPRPSPTRIESRGDDAAAWEQVLAHEAAIVRDKQQALARAMQEEVDPDEGLWWVEDGDGVDMDGGADEVRDGPG